MCDRCSVLLDSEQALCCFSAYANRVDGIPRTCHVYPGWTMLMLLIGTAYPPL